MSEQGAEQPAAYYESILRSMFPNHGSQQIHTAIEAVRENILPELRNDHNIMLESMINMLTGGPDTDEYPFDPEEDEAFGYQAGSSFDERYDLLLGIFPDAKPTYLADFVKKRPFHDFNDLILEIANGNYEKKDVDYSGVLEQLTEMLPNADPEFLESKAKELALKSPSDLGHFLDGATRKGDYPSKQEYLLRTKVAEDKVRKDVLLSGYSSGHFNVVNFFDMIPNPTEYFSKNYKPYLIECTEANCLEQDDVTFALNSLYNRYRLLRQKDIKRVFEAYKKDLIKTGDTLDRLPRHFKVPRPLVTLKKNTNEDLLKEIAYVTNRQAIKYFIKMKNDAYRVAREEATKYNLLETCQCCFDEALIPEECYFCNNNCIFCKDCVRAGAEHVIGKGDIYFPCLALCDSEFSLQTLGMVLDKKILEPLLKRIQAEEIKKANIAGLETCPFCDFSMIPPENDKIFKCQNIDCMIETCRECRHENHIPLRCNEVEYDEDVKRRTYIEDKMTEALIRKCYKCSKPFFKESGCNKMTCSCGAMMCYLCGAAIQNYDHFNKGGRCPLYTQNLNQYHATRIIQFANEAKNQLGITANPQILKIDPTSDVETHYNHLPHVTL